MKRVVEDAGSFDAAWCLGDLVGYGPDPNEVIDMVRSLPDILCVLGNHDSATTGEINLENFNPEAKQAVQWTQENLSEDNLTYLKELPHVLVTELVTLVHGSPRHPVWEYLLDTRSAAENFSFFETDFCFVGHTHIPAIFHMNDVKMLANLVIPDEHTRVTMTPRAIMNPGSVGQPRDRDPRASYAIFDVEAYMWEYHRVKYEVDSVQERMREAGLPKRHIDRLKDGW